MKARAIFLYAVCTLAALLILGACEKKITCTDQEEMRDGKCVAKIIPPAPAPALAPGSDKVRCQDAASADVYAECRFLGDNFTNCYNKAGCWQDYDVPDGGKSCQTITAKMKAKHANAESKWQHCKT